MKREKNKLIIPLSELEPLLLEIYGGTLGDSQIKGLLSENLNLSDKYFLSELSSDIEKHYNIYRNNVKEFLDKNNIKEGEKIDEILLKELNDLQNNKIEINFKYLNINNLLNIKSDRNYPFIWKYKIYKEFIEESQDS